VGARYPGPAAVMPAPGGWQERRSRTGCPHDRPAAAGGAAASSLALAGDLARERGLLALLPTSRGPTWDLLTSGLGPDAALDADGAARDSPGVRRVRGGASTRRAGRSRRAPG